MSIGIHLRSGILSNQSVLDDRIAHPIPLHIVGEQRKIPSKQVAFVLPVFNEQARVHHVVRFVLKLYEFITRTELDAAIYLVNDGSTDQTQVFLDCLHEQSSIYVTCPIVPIQISHNTRKVGTFLATAQHILANTYLFVDADDSFTTKDIMRVIDLLQSGQHDVVVGSKAEQATHRPLVRRVVSAVNRFLVRFFLPAGVYDSQTGLKAFSRSSVNLLFPALRMEHGLAADLILLHEAKRRKLKVLQIPVTCVDRAGSHVDVVKDSLRFFRTLAKLAWSILQWNGRGNRV